MSDIARNFNNAIVGVFGGKHIWLWCSYHFFKSFNKNLIERVKDKAKKEFMRAEFYKMTKIIDIKELNSALTVFCRELKNLNKGFFEYFH